MSMQRELDESERRKADSSDKTVDEPDRSEEEEEIIDLEDVIELPDETLGDILSELGKEQEIGKEALSGAVSMSFDLKPERNADMKEDLLSELFEDRDEGVAPDTEESPKAEYKSEPDEAPEESLSPIDMEKKGSQRIEEALPYSEPEESPTDLSPPPEPSPQKELVIEEVIDQLEERLLETLQRIVESRLPDIVRTVLREEIERLKEELTGSLPKK